jgi:hypothetical protein
MRQNARDVAPLCGRTPDEMERIIQRKMEALGNPEAMDRTAATVEELRHQRDAEVEDTRNRKRNARKKKGTGKKK